MVSTSLIEIDTKCSDVSFKSCSSELYIDDKFVGYAPTQLFIPIGSHRYEIIKPGYLPPYPPYLMTGIADIEYGSKLTLDINLINTNETGGLSINSSPDGAQIFIDDEDKKVTTPTVISGLTPGVHKYKITLPGYEDIEGICVTALGQPTSIYVILTQLKDFGTLYVYPTPLLYGRIIPYILQGAKIYIDNVDTGKLLPSYITGLTKGVHTFRIERPGTIDREGMFIINGGDTLLISVYPILQPKTGMLVIHPAPFIGDPKIANVYIDGKDTGEHTHVRFALPEGTHTYRLQLEGYEDVEGKFDIATNRITRVTAYMRHTGSPILGRTNIVSNPPSASVAIDDIYIGQYTPTTVRKLFEGEYTYRLSKPGYLDETGTFTMTHDKTVDLNLSLIQIDTVLDISCNVIAATIYIDNHTEGWTTPTEIIGLPPGEHTYRLTIPDIYANGFEDVTGTFKLEDKKTTFVNTNINILKEGKGNLIINSVPTGAKIFIDDIDKKTSTPYSAIGIEPGIHTIKLTLTGHQDWIGSANIISGSIVSIFETLVPEKV